MKLRWGQLRGALSATVTIALVAVVTGVSVLWHPVAANADPALDEARSQVKQLLTKMRNANENLNRARDDLDDSQKRQDDLQSKLGELQRRYDQTSAKVGKLGAAAYQNGGNVSTSGMLKSGSPQTMLDQLSYIDVLNAENARLLREYTSARKQLSKTKDGIDAEVVRRKETANSAQELKKQLQADFDKWKKLRDRLSPSDARQDGIAGTYDGSASGKAEAVVKYAYAQLGKPYVFGAAGPSAFDCSGLALMAWQQSGVKLPHSALQQWLLLAHKVSYDSLQPGDLVFFFSGVSHMGIYIGNGNMIHAPEPGDKVKIGKVRVSGLPFKGAARPG
ncbi:MAG: NlpC/P60 family protein [Mycobacteriales bacterium]